ncbi:MAG: ankyrin repeat domain-containing protein [Thiotrichaceae bacterium]|nr:ankyrin repeat domain-containing protein [Thiotrichaceae bacterium]
MKTRNLYRSLLLFIVASSVLLPAMSAPFQQTAGYASANYWSSRLEGETYSSHSAFPSYCYKYARLARKQAKRRNQQCTHKIPLTSWNIRKRWSMGIGAHRNWCKSVSSLTSGREIRIRERQLKRCIKSKPSGMAKVKCRQNDAFHKAASQGNIGFVRRCLNLGFNINRREHNQWTALHSAARNGRLHIVKLLVNRGAAINPKDTYQRTPLDQAKIGGRQSTINYLISRGGY